MTQFAAPKKLLTESITSLKRRLIVHLSRGFPILMVGLFFVLAYIATPPFLYMYNLRSATSAMEGGMEWPSPREVDSVPTKRDQHALDQAVEYLSAAIRWQPNNVYAYRLLGQVYSADRQWLNALHAFQRAQSFAPKNMQISWEVGLVYEQMWDVVRRATREYIMTDLASAPIDAPEQAIDTVYCREGGPATCYVDLDRYTQTYATIPDGAQVTAEVLFMHPPAGVLLTRTIPTNAPAIEFLMGLDPNVRDWNSDGATFELWITSQEGERARIFQHTLEREIAGRGWVPGAVDLSQWAGQIVTLELRTTGGPAHNTVDDWVAWGNVAFTQIDAARYAAELPHEHMLQAWQQADVSASRFVGRAIDALHHGAYGLANRHFRRARRVEALSHEHLFRAGVAASVADDDESAALLAQIQEHDPSFKLYPVVDDVQIPGWDLRWFMSLPGADATPGTPIGRSPDTTSGVMWWSGEAVALIDIVEPGFYQLNAKIRHISPAPVEVRLGIDGKPIRQIALDRGDNSWETLRVPIQLNRGVHSLNIWYVNDDTVNGVDRNAEIMWVGLQR